MVNEYDMKNIYEKITIKEIPTNEGCLLLGNFMIKLNISIAKVDFKSHNRISDYWKIYILNLLYKDLPIEIRKLKKYDFDVVFEEYKDSVLVTIEKPIQARYEVYKDDYFNYNDSKKALREKIKIDIMNKIYNLEALHDIKQNQFISCKDDQNG